jgi:hypothetical protein
MKTGQLFTAVFSTVLLSACSSAIDKPSTRTEKAETSKAVACRGRNPIYTYPSGRHLYARYDRATGERLFGDCFIESCPAVCPFETAPIVLTEPPKDLIKP